MEVCACPPVRKERPRSLFFLGGLRSAKSGKGHFVKVRFERRMAVSRLEMHRRKDGALLLVRQRGGGAKKNEGMIKWAVAAIYTATVGKMRRGKGRVAQL